MIILAGDGKTPFIRLPGRVAAIYSDDGYLIYAAEQLTTKQIQQAAFGNEQERAELRDIALRNGLPYVPVEEVTSKFPGVNQGQVFKKHA